MLCDAQAATTRAGLRDAKSESANPVGGNIIAREHNSQETDRKEERRREGKRNNSSSTLSLTQSAMADF